MKTDALQKRIRFFVYDKLEFEAPEAQGLPLWGRWQ